MSATRPVQGTPGRRPVGADLVLTDVRVGYRGTRRRPAAGADRVVVDAVNATAEAGALTTVVGPNGAGKSTLLRSLLGLQPLLGGHVTLGDVELRRLAPRDRARRTAVVLTDRVEVGLLTGREVVELGRHPHHGLLAGRLDADEERLVADSLDRLGATELAAARFAELSDGQRQRLLLARALVQQPELLVLDEPSAFLDVGARVDLMALLAEVATERRMVVLVSTHEVELGLRTSAAMFVIDGHRLRSGTPTELIAAGVVGEVFSTARTRFDPDSQTFVLRGPEPDDA